MVLLKMEGCSDIWTLAGVQSNGKAFMSVYCSDKLYFVQYS